MRKASLLLGIVVACGDPAGDDDAATEAGSGSSSATVGATLDPTMASTTMAGTTITSTTSAETSTDTLTTAESSGSDDDSSTGQPPGTAGCDMPSAEATAQWVAHTLDVGGVTREYWMWLPPGYDPAHVYPIVYQFHGCSDGEERWTNNPPVEASSGADAIHVRGKAVASCWDLDPQGPDVVFFDALREQVEATFCADPARRFATGYSSGAFMTHVLACVRADVLRGVASIAGGTPGYDCPGPVAALLIHDANDNTVNISASIATRDDHLMRNGCDPSSSTAVDPDPCQSYDGCDPGLPVVWCQTAMQDHSRQDGLAGPAFWNFLVALPPL
jgi:polyhydroxybutyrate depolymerase